MWKHHQPKLSQLVIKQMWTLTFLFFQQSSVKITCSYKMFKLNLTTELFKLQEHQPSFWNSRNPPSSPAAKRVNNYLSGRNLAWEKPRYKLTWACTVSARHLIKHYYIHDYILKSPHRSVLFRPQGLHPTDKTICGSMIPTTGMITCLWLSNSHFLFTGTDSLVFKWHKRWWMTARLKCLSASISSYSHLIEACQLHAYSPSTLLSY